MVGKTLTEIRNHTDAPASAVSEGDIVSGRTGDRPVPVPALRFGDRVTARGVVRAVEQCRATLRRYHPRRHSCDFIVRRETTPLDDDRRLTFTLAGETGPEGPVSAFTRPEV